MSISTVIITKNEAKNIATCIESILSFSNEIIIVDDFSTDETKEIVLSYPKVKLWERPFDDYINQKNFGNSKATSEYILSLDADEFIPSKSIDYFQEKKYTAFDVISFHRINFFSGRAIRFGIWKNDFKIRLWKTGVAKWAGTIPHEHVEILAYQKKEDTSVEIYHNAYTSYEEFYSKSIHYAKLASSRYSSRSIISLFISMIVNPCFKFIKGFFFMKGFRDGIYGWYIAKISFLETFYKYYLAFRNKL